MDFFDVGMMHNAIKNNAKEINNLGLLSKIVLDIKKGDNAESILNQFKPDITLKNMEVYQEMLDKYIDKYMSEYSGKLEVLKKDKSTSLITNSLVSSTYFINIYPNSSYLYSIVGSVLNASLVNKLPLKIKYDTGTDNLIKGVSISTDSINFPRLLKLITKLSGKHPEYFENNLELPFLYEISNRCYFSNRENYLDDVIDSLINAKAIYDYLRKGKNNSEILDKSIYSVMLRNNLLVSNNYTPLIKVSRLKNIRSYYNEDKKSLGNFFYNSDNDYMKVYYKDSDLARKSFIEKFYTLDNAKEIDGEVVIKGNKSNDYHK